MIFALPVNNNLIIKATNQNVSEKSEAIRTQQFHLIQADIQKADYNDRIQRAIDSMAGKNPDISIGKKPHNSVDMIAMYSFDFAKQVQYPSNPDQPGAIFFKVPHKFSLFGVNVE